MLSTFNTLIRRWAMRTDTRIRLYRKLSMMLRYGVTQTEALDRLWGIATQQGRRQTSLGTILDEWRAAQRNGPVALASAVKRSIPAAEYGLINTGILNGRLDQTLDSTILLSSGVQRLTRTARTQLTYPALLFFGALGVFWFIAAELGPIFDTLDLGAPLTGLAAVLFTIAFFIRDFAPVIFLGIVGIISAFIYILPRWTGPQRSRVDGTFPFSLYRSYHGTAFLLSLSAMLASGEQLQVALSHIARHANPYVRERVQRALYWVNQGKTNIGEALHHSGLGFPDPEIIGDLRVFAGLPRFEATLHNLANEWLDDGIQRLTAQTNILKNATLVVIGLAIMLIYLGFYDLVSQINSTTT